jgi:hypothetical protein
MDAGRHDRNVHAMRQDALLSLCAKGATRSIPLPCFLPTASPLHLLPTAYPSISHSQTHLVFTPKLIIIIIIVIVITAVLIPPSTIVDSSPSTIVDSAGLSSVPHAPPSVASSPPRAPTPSVCVMLVSLQSMRPPTKVSQLCSAPSCVFQLSVLGRVSVFGTSA